MVNALRADESFVKAFLRKPQVQFGLKVTSIALAAIAMISISVAVFTALFPFSPILSGLGIRLSFLVITAGALKAGKMAYDRFQSPSFFIIPLT